MGGYIGYGAGGENSWPAQSCIVLAVAAGHARHKLDKVACFGLPVLYYIVVELQLFDGGEWRCTVR